MLLVVGVWTFLRAVLVGSAATALENLALRHPLRVLQRSGRRPRLARRDRLLWVWLSRVWAGWRSSLVIVQPATVLAWHRRGLQLYWRWKSRPNPLGRPKLDAELRPSSDAWRAKIPPGAADASRLSLVHVKRFFSSAAGAAAAPSSPSGTTRHTAPGAPRGRR